MITPDVLLGFTVSVLAPRYDVPRPVPPLHEEMWELCCSDYPQVAIAAPRGHAKSTAITFAYVIANLVFRQSSHVLILSANEDIAKQFVYDIKMEFEENEALQAVSGFKKFIKGAETELIGQFQDGGKFRIIAKGAGQRMRGMKWERKRPDLVIVDDLEDDEAVLTIERREKLRRWFYGAVRPITKEGGKIRVVGTIVHMDSLLERMMPDEKDPETVVTPLRVYTEKDRAWKAVKYRAHSPDFKHILWPEMFTEETLRKIRQDFLEQGILDVYSQEYLNNPVDDSTAYFKDEDFIASPNSDVWRSRRVTRVATLDPAISQKERADESAIAVGALDQDNVLEVQHIATGRWDAREIIDKMFDVQIRYQPDIFVVESGAIERSIGPFLNDEMRRRGVYINVQKMTPTKDKESRARSFQARMKAHSVRWPTHEEWYPKAYEQLRRFPKGVHDDIVDACAWLGLALDEWVEPPADDEWEEYLYEEEFGDDDTGRSAMTGY